MRKPGSWLLRLSLFGFAVSGSAALAAAVPLSLDDALQGRSFRASSSLAVSPDGRWLAYVVESNHRFRCGDEADLYVRTGLDCRDQGTDLWMLDLRTRETWNVTNGKGSNWAPAWAPNARLVAFLSARPESHGQAALWIYDVTNRSLRATSDAAVRATYIANPIEWLPDSQSIVITAVPENLSAEDYARKVLTPTESDVTAPARSPQFSGISVLRSSSSAEEQIEQKSGVNLDVRFLHDLILVNAAGGTDRTLVRGRRIGCYSVSRDGSQIAYGSLLTSRHSGLGEVYEDLIVLSLTSMQEHVVLSNVALNAFAWSPDSRYIAYSAMARTGPDYYVVDARGASPRKISDLPYGPSCCGWQMPSWDSAGEFFYFVFQGSLWRTSIASGQSAEITHISNHRITNRIWTSGGVLWTFDHGRFTVVAARDDLTGQDQFYRIELHTGLATGLGELAECYTCKWPSVDVNSYVLAGMPEDEHFLYTAESASAAPDLWLGDASGRASVQLTHLNPQLEKYPMGTARVVEWLSDDGDSLRGALLLPAEYEPGKKYPLIVWVYPELQSHLVTQFAFGQFPGPFNLQLFATRGYAVLLPDILIKAKGEWAESLAKCVLPGVNKIIEMGIADPARVGIMGHSYGGWSVLTLITQTRRFKAAVESDGIGDFVAWQGMLAKDGSSHGLTQAGRVVLGGSLWDMPLKYLEHSPILFLNRVETPLLIVQGGEDDAAPAFLSDEVFVGLRELEKEAEYRKYEDEGHVPRDWSLFDQHDLATRLISWMEAHLNTALPPGTSSKIE